MCQRRNEGRCRRLEHFYVVQFKAEQPTARIAAHVKMGSESHQGKHRRTQRTASAICEQSQSRRAINGLLGKDCGAGEVDYVRIGTFQRWRRCRVSFTKRSILNYFVFSGFGGSTFGGFTVSVVLGSAPPLTEDSLTLILCVVSLLSAILHLYH